MVNNSFILSCLEHLFCYCFSLILGFSFCCQFGVLILTGRFKFADEAQQDQIKFVTFSSSYVRVVLLGKLGFAFQFTHVF